MSDRTKAVLTLVLLPFWVAANLRGAMQYPTKQTVKLQLQRAARIRAEKIRAAREAIKNANLRPK